MKKIIYLLLIAAALISGCSKKSVDGGGDTGGGTTVVNGKPLPAGANDGVTFINSGTSVIFNLYAPGKTTVGLIGDFNNWTAVNMNETPDGTRWWVQVDNLDPNKEYSYQYLVNGTLKVADPYCEKILDPANDSYIPSSVYPNLKPYPTGQTGIVSDFQYNQAAYSWKNSTFTRPDKKNLVIYELHVRDFIGTHSYKTLKDTLSYLSNLGINAVELMPVNEFEGNDSWGYNPDFYFAPDKYYGTKNDLKALIDECHSRGMAVILDMVLNHSFGSSPMVQLYFNTAAQKPTADNPWFNVDPTHSYNVGYDFNHESAATKYFAKNVMKFWMTEYKIDGYRFDLAKGFTQKNTGADGTSAQVAAWGAYDASRVAIWKDYNSFIKSVDNNNFYVILENFASDQEEKEESDQGMMQWNNLNYNFNEATMGYVSTSDLSGLFFTPHTYTAPDYLVGYMESHDEERIMFKNETYGNTSGSYNVKDLATGLKRTEAAAAYFLCTPGPKMIWEFGERGYDISIDNGGRLGDKPPHWEYMSDPLRKGLYNAYAKLIRMKINNPIFTTSNVLYNATGAIKSIALTGTNVNVMVVANFDVVTQTSAVAFPSTGTYYDYYTNSQISASTTFTNVTLAPGEYHIYSTAALK